MEEALQATILSGYCIMQGLLQKLIDKKILTSDEISDVLSEAEAYLAGIPPDMTTQLVRQFALGLIRSAL